MGAEKKATGENKKLKCKKRNYKSKFKTSCEGSKAQRGKGAKGKEHESIRRGEFSIKNYELPFAFAPFPSISLRVNFQAQGKQGKLISVKRKRASGFLPPHKKRGKLRRNDNLRTARRTGTT